MNTQEHEKRGPGRPRKDETRDRDATEARRRKQRGSAVIGKRLGVNKTLLDFERYVYRWINDAPARIMAMTKDDDWDIVRQGGDIVKDDNADLGDAVAQVVGTKPDGSAMMAYLCRKPRKFYDEDQADKQAALDEQLAQMKRGLGRDGSAQGDYVPHSGISL